jgi:tRNA pseudouridine55 synthase
MGGIVILDKPGGLSSNGAMGRLKRLLGVGKMGYLGTLDPLATGVLPVFVGKATKLIPHFEGLDKTYRCTLRLGQRTDTFDAEGQIISECPLDGLTGALVRTAILALAGEQVQTAPPFSAVKVNGVPAYKLARQGMAVPERARAVRLWDLTVESVALPEATFCVTCSAGTYVRSLVERIGQKLGVGAHLTALRRLRCGGLFTLEKSFTLEQIEKRISSGDSAMVRNPVEFLTDHLILTLTTGTERSLRNGKTVPLGEAALEAPDPRLRPGPGVPVAAVRPDGMLVAVGKLVAGAPHALSFHPTKVLIEPANGRGEDA